MRRRWEPTHALEGLSGLRGAFPFPGGAGALGTAPREGLTAAFSWVYFDRGSKKQSPASRHPILVRAPSGSRAGALGLPRESVLFSTVSFTFLATRATASPILFCMRATGPTRAVLWPRGSRAAGRTRLLRPLGRGTLKITIGISIPRGGREAVLGLAWLSLSGIPKSPGCYVWDMGVHPLSS